MTLVKKFSQQLFNLAQTMSRRFPEDRDLFLAVKGLEMLMVHNPRNLMNAFISHVYLKKSESGKSYVDLIKERDDEYFLNNTLLEKNAISDDNETTTLSMISSIQTHWGDLSNEEKTNVWIYLDVLFMLAGKYISNHINQNK